MTVQVSCDNGRLEDLRGTLDTGAGYSVMSVSEENRKPDVDSVDYCNQNGK